VWPGAVLMLLLLLLPQLRQEVGPIQLQVCSPGCSCTLQTKLQMLPRACSQDPMNSGHHAFETLPEQHLTVLGPQLPNRPTAVPRCGEET
jgi:hypothetical protein